MDRLFTEDNMRSRAVLLLIFGYLSLEELLEFQEVSSFARSAVRNYRWPGEVLLNSVIKYDFKDATKKRVKDRIASRPGPIIRSMSITLSFGHSDDLEWLLLALIRWSPCVERLKVFVDVSLSRQECDDFNERADIAMAQEGVIFSRCTQLNLYISPSLTDSWTGYTRVLPNLLRHFPTVESLRLISHSYPLLNELPALENLRILNLVADQHFLVEGPFTEVEPITANFERLETLVVHTSSTRATRSKRTKLITISNETDHVATAMTGIRWLASFTKYPPARLHTVKLRYLTNWTYSLMATLPLQAPSVRLPGVHLSLLSEVIAPLEPSQLTVPLTNITRLTILKMGSEVSLNELLALTPSLQELHLSFSGCFNSQSAVLSNLTHRLPSLRKLVINGGPELQNRIRPGWLESFRRNASPAGLQILLTNEEVNVEMYFK